jgi:hypothetical protein
VSKGRGEVRIRSVKPDYFRDEKLSDLETQYPELRIMLVFEGLWCVSSGEGVFVWNPRVLKLDILPLVQYDLERSLHVLESSGMIRRFEADGKVYGHIVNFLKHQRISNKEALASPKYPKPGEYLPVESSRTFQDVPENTGPEKVQRERKGKERKGEDNISAVALVSEQDRELYHNIERGFLSHNGDKFTNYALEGKAIHELISKARARDPDHYPDLLITVCAQFWKLKQGVDKFWTEKPFLPHILANKLWDMVLESMRREEIPADVMAVIER